MAPNADLARICEHYFAEKMADAPLMATQFGVSGWDDQVGDPSAEGDTRRARELTAISRRLDALNAEALTGQDRISYSMLRRFIADERATREAALGDVGVSASVAAVQAGILGLLPATPLTTPQRRADYMSRLRELPGFFDATLERYRQAQRDGREQTARGVRQAIAQLDAYLARPVQQDPLIQPGLEESARLVEDGVRPALVRWRTAFAEEFLPHARDDDHVGVCHVPGGAEGYLAAARSHTTTDLPLEEIHQIGLDVIAALREEFAEVGGRALGISDPDKVIQALRQDLSLRFGTGEEIVRSATEALERGNAVLGDWFLPYGIPHCEVREIPSVAAKGSGLGYYTPPITDGSRPGVHWVNTSEPGSRAVYEYEALAFHESVPGHHLQLSIGQTLQHLPDFRRFGYVTAHGEGWGLYSERLADEMGLYTGDVTRLGMLSFDAWRACRLVVDTGMHHQGWSRGRAVDFMLANSAVSLANIDTEIDRYISWPGQALAYMIGRLRIQDLRRRAKTALGAAFDIRVFHDKVLANGPVPLGTLDEIISEWASLPLDADPGHAST